MKDIHKASALYRPALIALDLDGTLLNSDKELSPRNRAALARAAASGIEIVPATGRFFMGMPQAVRELPFVRYAITVNGSEVWDRQEDRAIYSALIPVAEAAEILAFLDTLPVIYDCYRDGWGYMTAAMQEKAAAFAPNEHYLRMIRELRTPVPDLKANLAEVGHAVQKIQLFTQDLHLRQELLADLPRRFPSLAVSSSVENNVEINHALANKGDALLALSRHLELPQEATMAFGDGLNDISMLQKAGVGVAMGNAVRELRQAADLVTADCDSDGVAQVLETLEI